MKQGRKVWMAVYTQPRSEKKVFERLESRGVETYCPLGVTLRQWSDRKKLVKEPLFKSYVFVRITSAERLMVLETPGVRNFVFWLGEPAVIRDEEILGIRRFLDEYEGACSISDDFEVGTKATIIQGQLMGIEGLITDVKRNKVYLKIESLGLHLMAEIDKKKVALIR